MLYTSSPGHYPAVRGWPASFALVAGIKDEPWTYSLSDEATHIRLISQQPMRKGYRRPGYPRQHAGHHDDSRAALPSPPQRPPQSCQDPSLKLLVGVLQAYVFAILTCIYLREAVAH